MNLLSLASLLGLLTGMRHALEPDHVAAVSTIVSSERNPRRAARIGLAWGVGHTLVLLLVGGSLLVLRLELPGWFSVAAELCVGVALIGLGALSVRRALREGRRGPVHYHAHGAETHVHPAAIPHVHVGPFVLASRPLFFGFLHGLAGTGALAAMVLASMPTLRSGLLYITVFGVGSIVGMTVLAGVLGAALQNIARGGRTRVALQAAAGALSLVLGVVWVWVSASGLMGR